MGRGADLETFREIFKDQRPDLALGVITQLGAYSDRSMLRVQVRVFPDEREIVAIMTWQFVGTDSGDFEFPNVGDLVLVCFLDKSPDDAFVIARLTSKEDTMPPMAMEGHRVSKAKKKLFLNSPEAIHLTRGVAGEEEGIENLVLGQVLKLAMSTELTASASAADELSKLAEQTKEAVSKLSSLVSALSTFASALTVEAAAGAALTAQLTPITAALPGISSAIDSVKSAAVSLKSDFEDIKESPVDDDAMLSDIAFTEKGSS